ncbi:MAG: threonylcarbamoyl-AMP synthase [Methanomicrobiales archaeon]|jgi:L-threonylcarbamoyladenylate synthase|nr:threonylcarbamoyl-AMP synthase [Methanomicrobiales archaeon]
MIRADLITQAVRALSRDELVVYPTDTLYGLGADVLSDEALINLYEAKGRDFLKPVSIACSNREMLETFAYIDECASACIDAFFPGPVTLLLKPRSIVPQRIMAGTKKIGVRIPRNPTALSLISEFDSPITATSANRSGDPDPKVARDCTIPCAVVLDDGPVGGIGSTIVDLVNFDIVRQGAYFEEICAFLAKWS